MSARVDPALARVRSERTGVEWEPVIGLEVHCQLATRTKLFCGCENAFGGEPNTRVCAVCSGQPGALPVLNARALELAARAALAFGCELAERSWFDRKNYFYCDLPKGYQISQYDRPFASGGGLELASGRRVRLRRIHLEEDAGKAVHDRGDATLVDLNRAGVPLIESVTEPDLRSPAEAHEVLASFREVLRWIGASDCDMERGSLRCDVNVSVRPVGDAMRTKVELKNLNSLRHVRDALAHEVARQIEGWEGGSDGAVRQETRLWDPARGETRPMRRKEEEADYRYFREPDLPPLDLAPELVERERASLPEPPAGRRARWRAELGVSEYDAGVLSSERAVAELFEETARVVGDAKTVANWIANDLLAERGEERELGIDARGLAELVELVRDGRLARNAGRAVLREMRASGRSAEEVVGELGLEQVRDASRLEAWCREVIAERPEVAREVREGNEKALGALIGPVLAASGRRADPKAVRATLARLLRGGGSSS